MVSKTFNPADYRLKQEKKLNQGRKPGFMFDVSLNDNNFTVVAENASTECILAHIEQQKFVAEMYPVQPCTCIICNLLLFKLLNLPTLWAFEPYTGMYIYYFALANDEILSRLKSLEHQGIVQIYTNYALTFNKYQLPKFCPDWGNYRVASLPQLTEKHLTNIKAHARNVIDNEQVFFQINNLKPIYNAPLALSAKLGKTVLSINAHIVLEHLLQVMTHSSAVIDNTYALVYVADYAKFRKAIALQGRHGTKDDTIINALEELKKHGIIDNYGIADNALLFETSLITKHIKQRIRRNMGYYSQLPHTKQAPYIAAFINYLNWIINCPTHYEKLTIALDTLLCQLGMERLLTEHRNGEIAKILNTLRNVGIRYGLLQAPGMGEITSADVKYLLQNRTELHKYMILHNNAENGKENN